MTRAELLARESSEDDLAQQAANLEWAMKRARKSMDLHLALLHEENNGSNPVKLAYFRLRLWLHTKLA